MAHRSWWGTSPRRATRPASPSTSDGDLFIADGARIVTLRPNAASPPTATVYATDVPGANGVAFDRDGRLWVSDGATAQGRVWRIGSDRIPVEMFRVQPMANEVNVDAAGVGGVGRDNRGLPPGTITITPTGRQAANTLGSQHLVANGLAFDRDGDLLVADTARGAIWHVAIDHKGRVKSPMGCDTTFTANTLCLDNVLVAHPFLEGVDGIVLDRAGNIIGAVNERNAIVVVTTKDRTVELFRNPVDGDAAAQRGPAGVPDQPGDRRPHAVRDELGRRAARQRAQHRGEYAPGPRGRRCPASMRICP